MNLIGNNCVGGRWFQQNNEQFSNPFIWMVLPYDSIYNLLTRFYQINWANFKLHISPIRPNTFILSVDQLIDIHYVHYINNPKATELFINRNGSSNEIEWTGQVEHCRIWEYVVNKYIERTRRMVSRCERPCFIIRDETYGNSSTTKTLKNLVDVKSEFKRFVITTDRSITRNDNLVSTIHTNQVLSPLALIERYNKDINKFFDYKTR